MVGVIAARFLLTHWREATCALVLLFAVSMCRARDASLRREGAMAEQVKEFRAREAGLLSRIEASERHIAADTVVIIRRTRELDTLFVEKRYTDTVWVAQVVEAADSLKRACRRLQADCGLALAQKDSLLGSYRQRLSLIGNKPSRVGQFVKLGAALGVGVLIGKAIQ